MSDTPAPLRHGDRIIAVPGFRTLAWVDGTLADETTRQAAIDLLDLYVASWSSDTVWMRLADHRTDKGAAAWDAAAARNWLQDAQEKAVTIRGNGAVVEGMEAVGLPHIRIEQRDKRLIIEVSIPPDGFDADFADGLIDCLTQMPLFCAVQGMGFYMPDSLMSLVRNLPQSYPRYRTAIEIPVENGKSVLKRQETSKGFPIGAWADFKDAKGGLPDIGWRTVVSMAHYDRLQPLDDADLDPDVSVTQSDGMLVLTVGAAPIWGDLNRAEDIAAYQSVAAHLAPIIADPRIAKRSLFGAKDHDPKDGETVKTYLARLLPENFNTRWK